MKPILFNTEMVKAILEGRKSCTRRVVKNIDKYLTCDCNKGFTYDNIAEALYCTSCGYPLMADGAKFLSVPYRKGDILYVRETWCELWDLDRNDQIIEGTEHYYYKANDTIPPYTHILKSDGTYTEDWIWRPSIHMSKEAARIFLKVIDVRVERAQDITEEQAIKEGISKLFDNLLKAEYEQWATNVRENKTQSEQPYTNYLWHGHFGSYGRGNKISDSWNYQCSAYDKPQDSFSSLWNSTLELSKWDTYGWNANPWVWVYEFERISKEAAENGEDKR